MEKINLDPYIYFPGDCREAMEFYKSIFGGELNTQAYDEVPGPIQKGMEGKLMHARLSGGAASLMASDTADASPRAAKVTLSLSGSEEEQLTEIFKKLSEGAEVLHPLKKEFWGDTFGNLVDKYGVEWMVNITSLKED